MRTRAIALTTTSGPAVRTTVSALVLVVVLLLGVSGLAQVSVSGEPPALAAPMVTQ